MTDSLNRTLIETTIRSAIKRINDDPERSVRNLVDMALSFSQGRFQQDFFNAAKKMLENGCSSYYKLIPDLVANVECERIVSFGMNVGYNSCTAGAKRIREIEAKENFNIPWSISLELSGNDYLHNEAIYNALIDQGKELGIYTWLIFCYEHPDYILKLVQAFPECAFIIFCSPDEITLPLLDDANATYNLMFAVEHGNTSEDACALLRSRNFLYAIFSHKQNLTENLIDEILCDAENLHAAFTIFLSQPSSLVEPTPVYQHILQTRAEQKYRTIPFDMIHDNYWIDSIISEQACSVSFTKNGSYYSLINQTMHENYNCFLTTLFEILKNVTPKYNL